MGGGEQQLGDWCKEEFSTIELGDKRLNMRFIETAGKLASQPLSSINQACENWKDTKAAYRLFDNENVTEAAIFAAHRERARERIKGLPRILLIQDTSHLNYSDHPHTVGVGLIGRKTKSDTYGLNMHTSLAVSTEGVPLGILSQEIWARDKVTKKFLLSRKRVPIQEKESNKWLKGLEQSLQWIPEGTKAVTVCDRESDMYEFIAKADFLETDYLIRAAYNHWVRAGEKTTYLWEHMETQPVQGKFQLEVETRKQNKTTKLNDVCHRVATLEVRFGEVELRRPPKKKVDRSYCHAFASTYVVWVIERNPPQGEEALEWMLLTSVPVHSFDDAMERVQWYKQRWHIENFHKVLKSGCRVEQCRLQTADRLKRYIALTCIIAWRLYWMTHLNRQQPEAPCSTILGDHEWKALYCRINKTKSPCPKAPTTRQAIRWIAQLGGFLGRKGDGEPGITTLWRGWQRLTDISEDWLIFNSSQTCG
jgi:Transposase DNA-binding/Transposase Tn5 dimerisation domain